MKTWVLGLAVVLGLTGVLQASSPMGQGYAGLSGDLALGQVLQSGSTGAGPVNDAMSIEADMGYGGGLSLGLPVLRGVGLEASLGVRRQALRILETYSGGITGKATTVEDGHSYTVDSRLLLFPAEWQGREFRLGENANPDGWVFWPSLGVTYAWNKQNHFTSAEYALSIPVTGSGTSSHSTGQSFGYSLALPLAPCATLWASYSRNSSLVREYAFGGSVDFSGSLETDSFGLNTYWDLVPGAGADASRAFIPAYGRVGQLKASVSWTRQVTVGSTMAQVRSLSLAAPISADLCLTGRVDQFEPPGPPFPWLPKETSRNDNTYAVNFGLIYAFGAPAER